MKKTFTLTCLILASIIGAGFASGKEIQVFFSKYGILSFFTIITAYFLFYYLIKLYLNFGHKFKPKTFFEANEVIFGKKSKLFNIAFLICYFIVLAGMFAGVYQVYLNISSPIIAKVLVLVTVVLCIIENSGGMKSISIINNIFIPITMLVLIISAFFSFNKPIIISKNINAISTLKAVVSLIGYLGINMLLTGSVLMQEGSKYNKKHIKKASLVSAVVLVSIIFLFNIVMLKYKLNSQMPMLQYAFGINYWWGMSVLMCIWFCIYSAITSLTYVLSGYFNKDGNSKFTSNLIVVVVAYIVSLFGFSKIISYLYPIIGVVGTIYSVIILIKFKGVKLGELTTMQTFKKVSNKGE